MPSDGFGRQYSVKVGALGGAFHGSQLSLSGSIPGGVLSESLTLEFIREDPDSYQDGIGPERKIISGVFHILPTGTTFNKEVMLKATIAYFPHAENSCEINPSHMVFMICNLHIIFSLIKVH